MRTETYRDFMYRNPEVFRDKVGRVQTDSGVNVCVQYEGGGGLA